MITLETAQTLHGVAEISGSIGYTLTGLELLGATETYKVLAQGMLLATSSVVYTVPSSKTTFIKQIFLNNISTGTVSNIKFYIGGSGSANQIITLAIPFSGSAKFDSTGWKVHDFLGIEVKDSPLAKLYDDTASPITYLGEALPGSLTGSAIWRVSKIDITAGVITTWADGNSNFDNIWSNRASLTYS